MQVCTFGTEGSRSAIAAACFKEGTMVKTLTGEKPIETITKEDYVYTTNGWEKVITPTVIESDKIIRLKTRFSVDDFIYCTPEHEILILSKNTHKGRVNGKWDKNEAIKIFPELQLLKSDNNIYQRYYNYFKNISPKWVPAVNIDKKDYALKKIDLTVSDISTIHWENEIQRKYGYGLSEEILINEDFCELIGIWLAEGSCNGQSICFTIHQKEEQLKKKILHLMWSVFQLDNFQIYNRKDTQAMNISFASKQLVRFFSQLFDVECITEINQWNKFVPKILMKIEPIKQLQLFKGWFLGDGYARTPEFGIRQSYEAKGTTVSKQLAIDMIEILNRNFLNPTIIKEHRKDKSKVYNIQLYSLKAKKLYDLKYKFIGFNDKLNFSLNERFDMDIPVIYNGNYYLKQKIEIDENYVENKVQKVYCLVTNSHNFTVNNVIVHNCRGYRSEEYPNGIEVETAQFLSSLIPVERGFLWTIDEIVNGNEEKDRKPNQTFINEVNKYPGLLEIIQSIEGLTKKMALKHLFH